MEFLSTQDKTLVFFCFRLRCFNEEDVLRVERAQRKLNVCSQVPKALVRRRFQPKSWKGSKAAWTPWSSKCLRLWHPIYFLREFTLSFDFDTRNSHIIKTDWWYVKRRKDKKRSERERDSISLTLTTWMFIRLFVRISVLHLCWRFRHNLLSIPSLSWVILLGN